MGKKTVLALLGLVSLVGHQSVTVAQPALFSEGDFLPLPHTAKINKAGSVAAADLTGTLQYLNLLFETSSERETSRPSSNLFFPNPKDCIQTRAAIEFGSSNIKVTVADVGICNAGGIETKTIIYSNKHTLNLKSLIRDGTLPEAEWPPLVETAIKLRNEVMEKFSERRIIFTAIATEAIRQATNSLQVVEDLVLKLGIPVRVLTQDEEAVLGFKSGEEALRRINPLNPDEKFSIIDTGGASVQIITRLKNGGDLSKDNSPHFARYSGKIGTHVVRSFLQKLMSHDVVMPFPQKEAADMLQYIISSTYHYIAQQQAPNVISEHIRKYKLYGGSRMYRYSILPIANSGGSSFTSDQLLESMVKLCVMTPNEMKSAYPSVLDPLDDFSNVLITYIIMKLVGAEELTVLEMGSSLEGVLNQLKELSWISYGGDLGPQWSRLSSDQEEAATLCPNSLFPMLMDVCYAYLD